MKQFFPDIVYNKAKRKRYFLLLALGALLLSGTAVAFFILKQTMIAVLVLVFFVIAATTIPSALASYPVKEEPIIEVDGSKIRLNGGKEELRASEILSVSVLVEVPKIKGTKEEKLAFLKGVASNKPTEKVTGACDLTVPDAKGKADVRYNIVYDCVGCLDALLEAGVKKYRLVFCMDKLSVPATFSVTGDSKPSNKELSEKERMLQLL